MSSELIGWVLIAGVTLSVLARTGPPKMLNEVSAQNEVDPTRWRHNGQQPTMYHDGNQPPILDEQVARMVLAF